VHRFEGPAALLSSATSAAAAPAWAAALADVVLQDPTARTARQSICARTANAATLPPVEALFSWVIAPVGRA
jgi:hypothetical protein